MNALLNTTIENEIARFSAFTESSGNALCAFKKLAPYIMKATPAGAKPGGKKLGVIAITHGNEVLGMPIVNHVISDLLTGALKTAFEIIFAAGNVPAARAGKRFLESDLNRSYARNSAENAETMRAREIETHLFETCDYLLDLHQTIQPAESPFLYFCYFSREQFAFINAVNPGLPTVVVLDDTTPGAKGQTTNQYMKHQRKICITAELGEKGFFADKFELGLAIAKKTISAAAAPPSEIKDVTGRLLRVELSAPVEHAGTRLNEGWRNLQRVEKDQLLGYSAKGEIKAPMAGYMLFPKYSPNLAVGQELYCLCREITSEELP